MLVLAGDLEIGEDEGDDKDIVHRERQLDEIAGDELEGLLLARAGACSARAKSIARENQTAVQTSASLNLTTWAWRWNTPRSRARKTSTQAMKPTQCQAVISTRASIQESEPKSEVKPAYCAGRTGGQPRACSLQGANRR